MCNKNPGAGTQNAKITPFALPSLVANHMANDLDEPSGALVINGFGGLTLG
jgi:hypothetical protein